ncbi:hypothetical protein [Massilia sp. YMA4]|uniref:DUF4329 domain-containing protein n=1 Tax=[Empedobacter] haloabium TaxID=592317 RepID=A0ABZ1URY3_9BURK|nr:hypothetical protein [Massilia sp. YMA4]
MRALCEAEMTFIAGGHDPDNPKKDIEMPRVIIEGQRTRDSYDTGMWDLLMERLYYVPPDASDPNDDHHACFLVNGDPGLKHAPGADVTDIRQAALMVQDYIKGQDQSIEWGALIIRNQYGDVRVGEINKGDKGEVKMQGGLAPGDKIVATVHSHPSTPGTDQSLPSTYQSNGNQPNDEKSTKDLIAQGFMDPNGLVYIIDNASGQMHEYDPFNISVNNRNNITDDLKQWGVSCGW